MSKQIKTNTTSLKYRYEFDEKSRIMYKFYYGPITIQHIQESWNWAASTNAIPDETVGFILDYRKASLDIEIDQLQEISKFYRLHPKLFKGKRIAIVTESHKDVVIPILVSEKDEGYRSRPFSTISAAIKWILRQ